MARFTVEQWSERDRLGIWVTDTRTDKTVAEFWDDAARELFEDGFFDARNLDKSVIEYCESVGLLPDDVVDTSRHHQAKYDHACGYQD